jgi:hypothetical protein
MPAPIASSWSAVSSAAWPVAAMAAVVFCVVVASFLLDADQLLEIVSQFLRAGGCRRPRQDAALAIALA